MLHNCGPFSSVGPSDCDSRVCIEIHFDIASIEAQWLALEQESFRTPFQSLDWIKETLSSVAGRRAGEPVFGLVKEGGRLVAIFPFVIRRKLFGTSIEWLAGHLADYNAPVLRRSFAERLPEGLFQMVLSKISKVRPGIDYASFLRTLECHPALAKIPPPAPIGLATEYDSHLLALKKDWRPFYRELRSKDTRRRIKSKFMAFRKDGDVRFMRVRSAEKRMGVAEQILDWKAEQLDRAGDSNPFCRNAELRRLIIAAAGNSRGPMEIFCIRLDGRPVAGVIVLLTNRVFHLWVTAYDPAASSRYSIGLQLIVKTLELAARSGFEFYDFLYGDENYKKDWCDIRVAMRHYYVPLNRKGVLICKALGFRLNVKKRLIARPHAMQAIRGARRQFQVLRAPSFTRAR